VRGTELVTPVDVVSAGRLAPSARGWSRRPVQRVDLAGVRARRKRWEHWAITTAEMALLVTIVDLDLFALVIVGVLDLATGRFSEISRPFRSGLEMPATVHGADVRVPGVDILERGEQTILLVDVEQFGRRVRAEIEIERPVDHETLNVVVPFDDERFAFTSKQVALRARGFVRTHRHYAVAGVACLDHGRGIWPWVTRWNWASAATANIGFSVGARWTDGSGTNENGLVIDGRLHNLEEDVRFELDRRAPRAPFRIHGGSVDLVFTPLAGSERLARKRLWFDLGLLAADLDLRFGHFDGHIAGHRIEHLFGWAEAFDTRW
jgi:hypothetical protein